MGVKDRAAVTAGGLLVAIILSQAPHFSLEQGDIVVDPEVVQPAVVTFRADLERRTQASGGSLCGGATTWAPGRTDLGSNVWPPASLLLQPRLGNGNDGISIKRIVTYAGLLHFPFPPLRWGHTSGCLVPLERKLQETGCCICFSPCLSPTPRTVPSTH